MSKYLMCLKTAVISFVMLAGSCSLYAQSGLSWEECVRLAAEHNPELVAAASTLAQAESSVGIVRSAALPSIVSEAGAGTHVRPGSDKQSETFSFGVSGRQLIFDAFATANAVSSAHASVRAAGYEYAVVSSNVRLDLRTAFIELIRAQELISLSRTIVERRSQNLKLVTLRYEAGREHKGAFLTAEADLAQAVFEAEQAQRDRALAQVRLVRTIGLVDSADVVAAGDFSVAFEGSLKPDFAVLAETTPFLLELAARKDAARFDYAAARADLFPQVYLDADIGKTGPSWPSENKEWSAGVTVSLPIFEGGRRVSEIARTRQRDREALAVALSGRNTVVIALNETWNALKDSLDSLIVKEKFLEAARERSRIANAQYSAGLVDFDDWIIIEDELVSEEKAYLNAQRDAVLAEARWIQAKGGVLEYAEE